MSMNYGKEYEACCTEAAEIKAFELEEIIYLLGRNSCSPYELLIWAELEDCITELLQEQKAAYLVPYYNMMTEIRRHMSIDNKHEFASFLVANRDLVRGFPAHEVLCMLSFHSAVGCAAALLEDPDLDVDVNVKNRTPLHLAALESSNAMTDLLLRHGADPNMHMYVYVSGTPLDLALFELRKHTFKGWTSHESTLDPPKLKEQRRIVRLLAPRTKCVEKRCYQLMYIGSIVQYTSLLMGAWEKLMVSSATEGGLETTPVAQHISQVLSNASLQDEICQHIQRDHKFSKNELVENLTIALHVVKTMWMLTGVLDCWGHSSVENVPMNGLSFEVTGELMKAAGSDESIQCLPHKYTSEAKPKELPKQNSFVEQGRPNQMLRSSTDWKFKTKPTVGTPTFLPCYRGYSTFRGYSTIRLLETARVKPSSSCNAIALTRACASLMWYAKRMIK